MKSLALTFMLFFLIGKLNILGQINHICGNSSMNKDKSLSDFSKMASTTMTNTKKTITLKILLVEFKDVKHRNPEYPSNLSLHAYTYDDFNDMLFSVNQYCSPNMYSPDGEKVFGSLSDYYRTVSNNKLNIIGNVINEDIDHDNVPDWIVLDSSKAYYDNNRGKEFRDKSKAKAKAFGLDISIQGNVFLAIIYAGHTYRSRINTLNPEAFAGKHEYIMGERFAPGFPYSEERDNSTTYSISHFAHIGIHVHEFGHLLGFEDHDGGKDNEYMCPMSKGCLNGPQFNGACPAPLNPYLRYKMGWIEIDSVEENSRVSINYNIRNPKVYKIQDSKSNCYFLIEYRKFNAQFKVGDGYSKDFNSNIMNVTLDSGVLVWRKLDGNFVKLIYSGGENCNQGNMHFFPGQCEVNVLSPWSDNRPRKMGYYWVPNTKPSLNCGLEIISINNDAAIVDFYVKDPWLSSPSKPKKVAALLDEKAALTWDKNTEPDLNFYRIYKKHNNSEFELYDSCEFNQYIDIHEKIDTTSNNKLLVSYKITAVDSSLKESNYSQEIFFKVYDNSTGYVETENDILSKYCLSQNYPNPFNPSTTIKYTIPQSVISNPQSGERSLNSNNSEISPFGRNDKVNVTLKVYDILGREVTTLVNQKQNPGNYNVTWDASNVPSGVYFYQLIVGALTGMPVRQAKAAASFIKTRKMILLR